MLFDAYSWVRALNNAECPWYVNWPTDNTWSQSEPQRLFVKAEKLALKLIWKLKAPQLYKTSKGRKDLEKY